MNAKGSTMVEEAKRVMDSRGFDYFLKMLGMLQALILGILVPILMGMSERQHQLALEVASFKAAIENRMPEKFPPVEWRLRIELIEKSVHALEVMLLQHCAEDKIRNEKKE